MHIKKYTEKDRYGNTFSYEFDVPSLQEIPQPDPSIFKPKGTDTVPAMLTPGENVINAEASRLPGVQPILDDLNDMGRAIQKKQGGPIPSYNAEGGPIIDDTMLDAIKQVESGGDVNAVSEVGASGPYQIMKATALKPGYGVTPIGLDERFDPEKSRAFAKQYLQGIMKANPDFTKDEVITAYHSGAGNVRKAKIGQEELGPRGQEYADKVNMAMNENEVPMPMARPVVYDSTPMESGIMSAQASTKDDGVPEEKGYFDQAIDYIKGIPEAFNKNLQYSEQLQREAVSPESLTQLERAAKYPLEIFGVPVPSDAPGKPTGTLYDKMYPVLDFLNPSANEVNQRISSQALEKIQPQIKDAKNQLDYMEKLISNIKEEGGQPNPSQIEKYESASKEYNSLLNEEKNLKGLNKTHKEMAEKEKSKGKDFMLESEKKEQLAKEKELKEKKQKEAAQAISDQLANEEDIDQTVMTNEEVADYIKKNPGKTVADKFIDKAKEVGGVVLDKSMEYFKNAFSNMFDGEELARMAMIYAGSRAMGYNHGASLNYGMKNYMKRVDANVAARKKFALSDKARDDFTMKSLKEYSKTGDINVLERKPTSAGGITGTSGTRFDSVTGLQAPVYSIGTGDSKRLVVDVNGQLMDLADPKVRARFPVYNTNIHDSTKVTADFQKALDNQIKEINRGITDDDKKLDTSSDQLSLEAYNLYVEDRDKFRMNEKDSQQLKQRIFEAQRDYLKDLKKFKEEKGREPTSIKGYYNKRTIQLRTKGVINLNDVKNTDPKNLDIVNDLLFNAAVESADGDPVKAAVEYKKLWQSAKDNWNNMKSHGSYVTDEDTMKSTTEGYDPFILWLQEVSLKDPTARAKKLELPSNMKK